MVLPIYTVWPMGVMPRYTWPRIYCRLAFKTLHAQKTATYMRSSVAAALVLLYVDAKIPRCSVSHQRFCNQSGIDARRWTRSAAMPIAMLNLR
jgi:hypothetical protein